MHVFEGRAFIAAFRFSKESLTPQMRAGVRGEERKWNTMVVLKLAVTYQITNENLR